jgi:hypothetical protein
MHRHPPGARVRSSAPSGAVEHLGFDLDVISISLTARRLRRSRRKYRR